MKTQLSLQQAIVQVYGKSIYKRVQHSFLPYYQFVAYKHQLTEERCYFYLLVLDSQYHISTAIYEKKEKKFRNNLHNVKIILINSQFQKSTYLLKSNSNMISIQKLLKLKRKCGELLDEQTILKILLKMLQINNNKKYYGQIQLTLDKIAINDKDQIILCNYQLYFKNNYHGPITIKSFKLQFKENILQILNKLPTSNKITNHQQEQDSVESFSSNDDYQQSIYPTTSNNTAFNQLMQSLLQQSCTQNDMKKMIKQFQNSQNDANTTVMTQSVVDDLTLKEELLPPSDNVKISHISLNFRNKKIKKIFLFFITIFIIIAIGVIAYLFFQFFSSTKTCLQGQYLSSQKRCLECADGCLRCQNSEPQACYSCIDNMYLVINSQADKKGQCLSECTGLIITKYHCVRQLQ